MAMKACARHTGFPALSTLESSRRVLECQLLDKADRR